MTVWKRLSTSHGSMFFSVWIKDSDCERVDEKGFRADMNYVDDVHILS